MKDKEYVVDTVNSIVQDADLDKCSEHETDPLGDSSFHDVMRAVVRMRALQIRCASREASIMHLKDCLESEANALKKFKESSQTLGQEVIDLKAKLSGMTLQTNELAKENTNLKSEVAVLHEHMDK
uniref:Uncharacterized protein n=1 Tax=Quercus lobata TaxID=97700 RepID=A0A7N2LXV5_QUELO